MATGDPVVQIIDDSPPATLAAQVSVRTGGSTPAERVVTWNFDAAATEYVDFKCRLTKYAGGGLTFLLPWSAASATTGAVRWEVGIRRVADDAEDIDTSQTYDYNAVTDTCASASGELSYPTIAFTNGADMDSWADGEIAIVRVRRLQDHADDNMAGDAELWGLFGRET